MIAYTQQSKVIIFCPPQKVTGGPEALHQLSDKLLRLGNRNVFMSYIPKKKKMLSPKAIRYIIHRK